MVIKILQLYFSAYNGSGEYIQGRHWSTSNGHWLSTTGCSTAESSNPCGYGKIIERCVGGTTYVHSVYCQACLWNYIPQAIVVCWNMTRKVSGRIKQQSTNHITNKGWTHIIRPARSVFDQYVSYLLRILNTVLVRSMWFYIITV